MPAAALAHTSASSSTLAQPVQREARPPRWSSQAMPMKIALWSARRIRRQARADQWIRWKAALVPNMISMPAT